MNCENFTSLAGELARGALLDAGDREEALAHAATCARCAALLADERSLSTGLRALAQSAAAAAATPRVESALLASFRARAAASACDSHKVVPLKRPAAAKQWSWAKTLATAATAAAAAVTFLMILPPWTSLPPSGKTDSRGAARRPEAGQTTADSGRESVSSVAAGGPTESLPTAVKVEADRVGNEPFHKSRAPRPTGRVTLAKYAAGADDGRRATQTPRPADNADARRAEIVTDFIPLMQGARLASGDGGHVVRVELPRSALERFGLPMNVERMGERVKADVLLGEDGLARAIRFVR